MRWDAGRGFHVPGLAHKECASVDDMLNVRSNCPDAPVSLLFPDATKQERRGLTPQTLR